jgi:hypothetical protein
MFIQHNEVFGGPNRSGGIHPLSFDRNLMASLLASIYSAVLKEPFPTSSQASYANSKRSKPSSRIAEEPASPRLRQH